MDLSLIFHTPGDTDEDLPIFQAIPNRLNPIVKFIQSWSLLCENDFILTLCVFFIINGLVSFGLLG